MLTNLENKQETHPELHLQARMPNPAMILPETMPPIKELVAAIEKGGVPSRTMNLVHLRVSQINGCSFCLDLGTTKSKQAGESDTRLFAVAAWRESPHFNAAERAALALAEAVTRLDPVDPVPDTIWEEATRHYDQRQMAALILSIALGNTFNRINISVRQVPGSWS
jgi:AhpD family alkylhydroperoxidase